MEYTYIFNPLRPKIVKSSNVYPLGNTFLHRLYLCDQEELDSKWGVKSHLEFEIFLIKHVSLKNIHSRKSYNPKRDKKEYFLHVPNFFENTEEF